MKSRFVTLVSYFLLVGVGEKPFGFLFFAFDCCFFLEWFQNYLFVKGSEFFIYYIEFKLNKQKHLLGIVTFLLGNLTNDNTRNPRLSCFFCFV